MDAARLSSDQLVPDGPGAAPGRTDGDRSLHPYAPVQNDTGQLVAGPRGRRGWIFSAIWLVYLVPTLKTAWAADELWRRAGGVTVILAFAALYVGVFLVARTHRWRADSWLAVPVQAGMLSAMSALTIAACLLIGQAGTAMVVYVAVGAALILPTRPVWICVAVLMAVVEISTRTIPGWTPDDGLSFSVFLAALAIWGITQMIARNRQLAIAQDEIARMAVTAERTRFARDLHDLLGHSLTVVTVKAELAGRLIPIDPERAGREIADVERLAREALADVRSAVAGYREISLAAEIVSARTALEAAGISAELPGALDDIPGDRRDLFGWTLREGVTNVVRHSGATRCRVLVTPAAIEILDDGRGPGTSPAGQPPVPGNGLIGLGERAAAAGAAITVGRAPADGGFRLRVGW